MYTLFEIPPSAKAALDRCRALVPQILAGVEPQERAKCLTASTSFYEQHDRKGKIYCLTDGMVSFWLSDGNLINFEEGDLLGLEQACDLEQGRYASEFAVQADEYDLQSLLADIGTSSEKMFLWTQFLVQRINAQLLIMAALSRGEREFHPKIRAYRAGEIIIEQGAPANEVYTLIEGKAEAFVDGVRVGEVQVDEIFGALAALTRTTRTARVVAFTNCLALALETPRFLELVQNRPSTVLKMVEDMARTIVSLNRKVVDLQGGQCAAPG